MKNKEIQEQRMKGYFIEATRDILKSEGLKSVSVRNIASKAGYSYATLYNYFKDANDLVFVCVEGFFNECREFVESKAKKKAQGLDRLRATVIAYAGYFVEYPGVFDLFFLERIGDLGHKQATLDIINTSFEKISAKEWDYCMANGLIQTGQIEPLKNQIKYSITGLLLMYLNRYTPQNYSKFVQLINEQLDLLLEGKTAKMVKSNTKTLPCSSMVNNSLITFNIGNK
jgi:AcrR family transcriptional regulator